MPVTFPPLASPRHSLYLLTLPLSALLCQVSHGYLCPLLPVCDPAHWIITFKKEAETPLQFSHIGSFSSAPLSPTTLCSHLILLSADCYAAWPRSRLTGLEFPEDSCTAEAAQHLCKWVRTGLGMDLKGNILWEATLGDGIRVRQLYAASCTCCCPTSSHLYTELPVLY